MILAEQYDFYIHVGADFERIFQLKDDGRTPIDLTGASFSSYIAYSAYIDDKLPLTVSIIDLSDGVYRVSLVKDDIDEYFQKLRTISFFYWKLFVSFDSNNPYYPNKRFLLKEGRVIPVFRG